MNREERIADVTEELFDRMETQEADELYLPGTVVRDVATRVVDAEEAELKRVIELIGRTTHIDDLVPLLRAGAHRV